MKHSKQKGNLGFSSVVKELHKHSLNVFSEIGDYSKIDLIVEVGNRLFSIQIKYATEKSGYVILPLRKCGPNGYRYHYEISDVDIFAVYLPKKDKVIFIPSKIACIHKSSMNIRFEEPRNGQRRKCNFISEFEDFHKVLSMMGS